MISKLSKSELDVLRNIPIHDLLGIQRDGRMIKIKCPFHNEKTASFVLYPDNSYHAYCCGRHGNGALDFLIAIGYSFQEALDELQHYL